jgi:outer membrane protein OmpA-like peptidoglycan-associated protein
MKGKILLTIIIMMMSIILNYGQEKYYREAGELIQCGYYEKALPLVKALGKFKKNDQARLMEAYILFKQRNYKEAEKLYNEIKNKKHKKTILPVWYYQQLATIKEYHKEYDLAVQYLMQLKSKLEEYSEKEYLKYRKLYNIEEIGMPVSQQYIIANTEEQIQRLQYLSSLYKNEGEISSIEYESYEKKPLQVKGIYTGIGEDEIKQELVSIKLEATEGIEVNAKDKYKSYYSPYGFKYTEETHRTLPALRSHFFTAGITYDSKGKKYIYSKTHTNKVELNKKEQKLPDAPQRNYMRFFETARIEENATPVKMKHNNADFIHPVITANGEYLYFATNLNNKENFNYDIAYVKRKNEQEWDWENIVILSEKYNTSFNELYPTISGDTLLTYSSNGVKGYGGYDIVAVKLENGMPVGELEILPAPINSYRDDYGYKWIEERKAEFYTNRDSLSNDEQYVIEYPLPLVSLKIKVVDKNTNQPLADFEVTLSYNNQTIKRKTNDKGEVLIDSLSNKNEYIAQVSNEKFIVKENKQNVKFDKKEKEKTVVFKAYKKLEKKDKIEFRDILFEYDKADLLTQSYVELDKILQIIKDNPYAKFELSAHTDSRGKDSYNLKLSQKRAESCVNYLIAKGVTKDAIIAKGYGEKQLKNKCGNNVKCTEDEHAINRRVEIKVIDIKQ